MLTVELDIFSGRPNPVWTLTGKEERDLIDRVTADRSLMAPLSAETGGLGYRGFIVRSAPTTDQSLAASAGVPSVFRLGGHFDKATAAALWALETSEKSGVDLTDDLRAYTAEAATSANTTTANGEVESAATDGSNQSCAWYWVTSDVDFSFWNGSAYITKNNCYNFASNYRTNTFAQPGRYSGHPFTSLTAASVSNAVRWDGYYDGCFASPTPNLKICLVIWPGQDFHFYRLCANNHWCHKPGKTAARNYDNSGHWITSVATCNRGPYSIIAGYFYWRNSYKVVS